LRPTISSARLLARRLAGGHRRDHRALAHDRDVVGRVQDLAQLVRDEHDGLALALERAEDLEQAIGLLRREHRGRLVEDQDLGAAMQRLEDLDALLQADRQVADHGVGIDLEAVLRLELADLLARPRQAGPEAPCALDPQHEVLQHGHVVDQHEMLVDHADAGGDRLAR
jgi:hypothetical protein